MGIPRAPQERPNSGQEHAKSRPRAAMRFPRAPKSGPRADKSGPREAKSASRAAKNSPRAAKSEYIDFTMVLHGSGGPTVQPPRGNRQQRSEPKPWRGGGGRHKSSGIVPKTVRRYGIVSFTVNETIPTLRTSGSCTCTHKVVALIKCLSCRLFCGVQRC